MPNLMCRKCQTEKDDSNWYRRNGKPVGYCKECTAKVNRAWIKAHKERYNEIRRSWAKRHRSEHYGMMRQRELKAKCKKYGKTVEWYTETLEKQDHVCAVCKRPEERANAKYGTLVGLSIDHDHVTGRVRGLVCNWCNRALAVVEKVDNWPSLAAAYLAQY
jgi:hypothetical protein